MLNIPTEFNYPENAFAPLFQHLTRDQAPRMIRSKNIPFDFATVKNGFQEFEVACKSYSELAAPNPLKFKKVNDDRLIRAMVAGYDENLDSADILETQLITILQVMQIRDKTFPQDAVQLVYDDLISPMIGLPMPICDILLQMSFNSEMFVTFLKSRLSYDGIDSTFLAAAVGENLHSYQDLTLAKRIKLLGSYGEVCKKFIGIQETRKYVAMSLVFFDGVFDSFLKNHLKV